MLVRRLKQKAVQQGRRPALIVCLLYTSNIEQPRQLDAVCACLIEHEQKVTVCKHGSRRVRLQQVVDVLRQPRAAGTVFAVSYTHLDVYKRQHPDQNRPVHYFVCCTFRARPRTARSGR